MAAKDTHTETAPVFGEGAEGSPEALRGTGVGTTGSAPDVAKGVMKFDPYTGTWNEADEATTKRHENAVSLPPEE